MKTENAFHYEKKLCSRALSKEYVMFVAYAHNIKLVLKKLNYESDENACLHGKQI